MTIEGDASVTLRPPAVPLVVHDPYFSVWSMSDRLTDEPTKHWTGAGQNLGGLLRVDGTTYRYAGAYQAVEPARQTGLEVWPTRTVYRFEAGGVELTLTFLTPALLGDLAVLSRPVTYVAFDVKATDGRSHAVQVYLEVGAEWAVDSPEQSVDWARFRRDQLSVLRVGSVRQPVLERSGDNLRIDWGHLYLATPAQAGASDAMGLALDCRGRFVENGRVPVDDDLTGPRKVSDGWPVLAAAFDVGKVTTGQAASRSLMVAYDDGFSIEYLHRKLRPYWRTKHADAGSLLATAREEYLLLAERCRAFDEAFVADLRSAGGQGYADLCCLAYRQCIGAHKLTADIDGTPMFFSKENFSNGCIATVDVTYPSSPLFLLCNVELLKAMLVPVLEYARTLRWRFGFAPHDLGTYPLANGQVYGGGELTEDRQMPVEESGNLLLLVAAIAKVEGNAEFAKRYWPLLARWAGYLREKGYNPENQLCTDDFAGHLACNANLSIKAILALGGYAKLCQMLGHEADARACRAFAEEAAGQWVKAADDGDHYRLALDRPGTWSQKYNLVWDRLLGLNLLPAEVAEREMAFYRRMQNQFGLPLDGRKTYTKLDWTLWSASLTHRREDFDALMGPVFEWVSATPTRVPLTDWFDTLDGRQMAMQARSVVGGVFLWMLCDETRWARWAKGIGHAKS